MKKELCDTCLLLSVLELYLYSTLVPVIRPSNVCAICVAPAEQLHSNSWMFPFGQEH